jgi:preprotein translocase subunit SecF
MELFDPRYIKFNFTKTFKFWSYASIALSILCAVLFLYPGFTYGIDFRGGIEARVNFTQPGVDAAQLREVLGPKLQGLSIVNFDEAGKTEFLVTAQTTDKESASKVLTETLNEKYGAGSWTASQMDVVGPRVGAELRKSALLSLFYTCLLIGLYMYWRFDIRYAPGVLLSLFHDLLVVSGFIVLAQIEFSTTVVAALLTLAGYSVNDTVVVFDRIREIEQKNPGKDIPTLVNDAANSTLSRTLLTGVTTLGCCVVLFLLGGPVLRDFAIVLFFGILVGTYSSIFVASPLYLWASRKFGGKGTVSYAKG